MEVLFNEDQLNILKKVAELNGLSLNDYIVRCAMTAAKTQLSLKDEQ